MTPAPPASVGIEDRLLTFAVSLLVGGGALHVGTHVVSDAQDYAHAVLTALLGALVWAVLEPVPLLGELLAIAAWIGVVRWRYQLGWWHSAGVAVVAWMAAVVILAALELLGIGQISALGVPGA